MNTSLSSWWIYHNQEKLVPNLHLVMNHNSTSLVFLSSLHLPPLSLFLLSSLSHISLSLCLCCCCQLVNHCCTFGQQASLASCDPVSMMKSWSPELQYISTHSKMRSFINTPTCILLARRVSINSVISPHPPLLHTHTDTTTRVCFTYIRLHTDSPGLVQV